MTDESPSNSPQGQESIVRQWADRTPPWRRRGLLMAVLAMRGVAQLPNPIGGILEGVALGSACLLWGGAGYRFGVPIAVVFIGYWSAARITFYSSFYATSAVTIPLFVLAALVDQRDALRNVARTRTQLATFLATVSYMILGEIAALYATGRCDPSKICALRGSLAPDGIAAVVVGGLAGGLAQLLTAAVLPPTRDNSPAN